MYNVTNIKHNFIFIKIINSKQFLKNYLRLNYSETLVTDHSDSHNMMSLKYNKST